MIDESLQSVELGLVGLSHVRARLTAGKCLSHCLLERINLDAGAVSTELPAESAAREIGDLDAGGIIDGELSRSSQIRRICDHLASSAGAVAVFEDQVAKPSDPFLQQCPTKMITLGDELFHFLDTSDANAHAVDVTLSWQASAGSEIIVLSSVSSPIAPSFPFETDSKRLASVAENTTAILVDVFDGEGFAIWAPAVPGAV